MRNRRDNRTTKYLGCFICVCLPLLLRLQAEAAETKHRPTLKLTVRFVTDPTTPDDTIYQVELTNISSAPVYVDRELTIDWNMTSEFRDTNTKQTDLQRVHKDGPPRLGFDLVRLAPHKTMYKTAWWSDKFKVKPLQGNTVYFRLIYERAEETTEQGEKIEKIASSRPGYCWCLRTTRYIHARSDEMRRNNATDAVAASFVIA